MTPQQWPILGHLPSFLRDRLGFLEKCAQTQQAAARLHIGEPALLLLEPEDIRHVLTTNASSYEKTPRLTSPRGRRISGSGLHTALSADHLPQRRLLQPLFRKLAMQEFLPLIRDRTMRRVSRWQTPGEIDLCSEMEQLTLDVIIGAIFGAEYEDKDRRLAQAITARRAFLEYMQASLLPMAEYLPAPAVLRYRRAMRVIDHEIEHGSLGAGFASRYAELQYPDGSRMHRKLWRDEVLTLMSTGYETIGDALTWTIYLLASHPEAEARVLEEMAAGGELGYTRMAIEEAMRLYPPTWIFVRMATSADRLPSGTPVEAGDKLYLCQYVTHRDARFFPEPERFVPERFADSARAGRPRFSYFPFGGGQRQCIGEHFAMQESLEVLSLLLPRFRFAPRHTSFELAPGVTLRPKGGMPILVSGRV
ncbi:MAG: cytochrome P450 [Bryobacteraceae bacterium]